MEQVRSGGKRGNMTKDDSINPEKLAAFGEFTLFNPTKCERCDKKLNECTHEDPIKAGLHFWTGGNNGKGGWYCDACLLQYGKEELERGLIPP
jgi:hypothetical protein